MALQRGRDRHDVCCMYLLPEGSTNGPLCGVVLLVVLRVVWCGVVSGCDVDAIRVCREVQESHKGATSVDKEC